MSNAPCGYLKYPLPETEREKDGAVGAKVIHTVCYLYSLHSLMYRIMESFFHAIFLSLKEV